MLKIRHKVTGQIWNSFREAWLDYCRRRDCAHCKMNETQYCMKNDIKKTPQALYEMLEIMNCEIVEDNPQQTEKPLAEWTLQEVKDRCGKSGCATSGGCPFYNGKELCLFDILPKDWNLQSKPRWTEQDIEDAKAIKRIFPCVTTVTKCMGVTHIHSDFCLYGQEIIFDDSKDIFPSMKCNQRISIAEILADGQK